MESYTFQPLPGTKKMDIYPYIRKIDIMSSNSFILSSEEQLTLIDPGAFEDQMDHLIEEISRLHDEQPRPTVIYLTHVHFDHFLQLMHSKTLGDLENTVLAVHELGADALEKQDSRTTLAELIGHKLTEISVDLRLFSDYDIVNCGQQQLDLGGMKFNYSTQFIEVSKGVNFYYHTMPLGTKDHLEVYHTPGHSPDSVCIQAGNLLFLGDLLFATNPGIAGVAGWSQSDLGESIQKVLWLLDHKDIRLCYSGHGRPLDVQTVRRALEAMQRDIGLLTNIEKITPEWARDTSRFAKDLMVEIERLFTIIAGRLAFIAHMLEELEEESEAEETEALINADLIDNLFDQFNSLYGELQIGSKSDLQLVLKAGQIVGKLDRIFEAKTLGSFFDQSMLRRASRLLNDYSTTFRGFRPPYELEPNDINHLIRDLIEDVTQNPYDEEEILLAESEDEYMRALKVRIAYVDIFEDVNLIFEAGQDLPLVALDKERFCDTLVDIFERFASAGAKKIRITASFDGERIVVKVAAFGIVLGNPLNDRALRFFRRTFALCGVVLLNARGKEEPLVEIGFLTWKGMGLES
jgi:glyoxylase-like metal-dependent hydrolase (beta-lactamase superfamily II)